jgi:hypothetical protein
MNSFNPFQYVTGFFGQNFLPRLAEYASLMKLFILFVILFIAFTEPLKVYLRKNIGKKALNIYSLLAGCTLYLAWGLILLAIAGVVILFPLLYYMDKSNESEQGYITFIRIIFCILIGLFFGSAARYWLKTFRSILYAGMNEHFRAKAEDSQDWRVLEYRGDSIKFGYLLNQGWDQERIWRIAEPVAVLKKALATSLFQPLIGLPIVFTALSFWLNEWYHVHYKWAKMKESCLEMKAETEKLNLLYNETELSSTEFFVQND